MDAADVIRTLLANDPLRFRALAAVASLDLPDGWIAAGFIRDAVWDHLHGQKVSAPYDDVDVIWFDPQSPDAQHDRGIERALDHVLPGVRWSVKNQARMHRRNGDAPYRSATDAMRHWPETATAVAARIGRSGTIEVAAPFGFDDLFALRLRPAPDFTAGKSAIFRARIAAKRWRERYPLLHIDDGAPDTS